MVVTELGRYSTNRTRLAHRRDDSHLTLRHLLAANGFQSEATAQADRRWLGGSQSRKRPLIQINVVIVTGQGRKIATGAVLLKFLQFKRTFRLSPVDFRSRRRLFVLPSWHSGSVLPAEFA
jgi:hypothetical protein